MKDSNIYCRTHYDMIPHDMEVADMSGSSDMIPPGSNFMMSPEGMMLSGDGMGMSNCENHANVLNNRGASY